MVILKFNVTGMTCAACSARVEKVTAQVTGVKNVEVNLLANKMTVEVDDTNSTDAIIAAVRDAGYDAYLPGKKQTEVKPNYTLSKMKSRIIISGIFLAVLMYFSMGHMIGLPTPQWYHGTQNAMTAAMLQFFLTIPVVYLNRSYYSRGLKALWHRSPNMDSLIAVGSGAALVYGVIALFAIAGATGHHDKDMLIKYSESLYFESAAMILTLITLGKYLETRAKGKTGDAIKRLMDLSPKTALVRCSGELKEIPLEDVRIGDIVVVRSGGRVPVDGIVLSGRAAVDQSSLTGESLPVEKSINDTVAAATIVTEGYIEVRADKVGDDTSLAQIIRLVEEAGGSKAPIARFADKIAGVFVPLVMSIAAITLLVWLIAGATIEFALTSAIAVLVISCPCALGLATPVAIMVGTGKGAAMGVLFKNAESLENLHKVDTVVLDKTGTLTEGKPSVTEILPNNITEDELLGLAAALESKSEHPFAKAILERNADGNYPVPDSFETLPGRGVCATINSVKYYGGNKRLMDDLSMSVPEYIDLETEGKTPLYFANEHKEFLGVIAAADTLKKDSAEAVRIMKEMGIDVVMLTGDNALTATAIAQRAGIEQVVANVLPGDKASAIEKLQNDGKKVLMVGDGINDAPALMRSDVGMAIGAGTDIAIESANVVLMNNSLIGVCNAIELSKATIRNIKQNLFWAFFYNCLGIPIAAGILYPAFRIQLSPMIGAAAMSFSSVFVVTNALRLRLFKTKHIAAKKEKQIVNDQEEKALETVIYVEGMMCPHCKMRVESVCKAVSGAADAVVDLEKKCVTVSGNASIDDLKKAIIDAGYEVIG